MKDIIFGHLIDPSQRLAQHQDKIHGVKHLHNKNPGIPEPGKPITLLLTTGGDIPFDAARCFYSVDDSDPALNSAVIIELQKSEATWDDIGWGYIQRWDVTIPAQPAKTMLRYHLAARITGTDTWIFADNQASSAVEATDFAIWVDENTVPDWSREALVYHIFLDRFYPGEGKPWLNPDTLSGFYGGTIRGVIQKLDYIQSLGFNTLWLSPLFASSTHHGYNASDYYTVEPRLGTREDLDELIEKAHSRGMRVLLDFVANHWSSQHPTFQSALKDINSLYHDWYFWHQWPDDYEMYFTVKELPKINLQPGPARDYMLECARYWLENGIDGYRLDFAYGPPHDFWADFRRACRSANPKCWIFGEVVHNAELQHSYAGVFDGNLDFLLADAFRKTFALDQWDLAKFEAFLSAHEIYFPKDFIQPSFLDNHDMNRFLFLAGNDRNRLKLAALVMYTLSGPPIIYNGTETGVTQSRPLHEGDRAYFEEARQPVDWGTGMDEDLVSYFRQLGKLRRDYSVLSNGKRHVLHLNAQEGTYAYLRENETQSIVVAVNISTDPRTLTLPSITSPASIADRLGEVDVQSDGISMTFTLPPQCGIFIA